MRSEPLSLSRSVSVSQRAPPCSGCCCCFPPSTRSLMQSFFVCLPRALALSLSFRSFIGGELYVCSLSPDWPAALVESSCVMHGCVRENAQQQRAVSGSECSCVCVCVCVYILPACVRDLVLQIDGNSIIYERYNTEIFEVWVGIRAPFA